MSMFPLIVRLGHPAPKNLQRVSLAVTPEGVLTVASPFETWGPWGSHITRHVSNSGNRGFEINLDVQHFLPEDISVKTVDGFLIVEANHEERQEENGWVERHFTRRYAIPEGCNIDGVESHLSSDGILTVKAPPIIIGTVSERIVPIMQTGPIRSQTEMKSETGKGESLEMSADTM